MIRSFFGLEKDPFNTEKIDLLPHQQEIFDVFMVHCQQGGFCLLLGEPGTGKSTIKEVLRTSDEKKLITPIVSRTLHTYPNILRIFCQAFGVGFSHNTFRCEKKLIEEAFRLNSHGKMIVSIIDDAHLLEIECLRKLRLLFEDFPKNHNLILIAQPELMNNINLSINTDIKDRITHSAVLRKLVSEDIVKFIHNQLDHVGLGHDTFSPQALNLIIRSSEGVIRKTRNICVSSLIEAACDKVRIVELTQVNRVLTQPHWRKEYDFRQM